MVPVADAPTQVLGLDDEPTISLTLSSPCPSTPSLPLAPFFPVPVSRLPMSPLNSLASTPCHRLFGTPAWAATVRVKKKETGGEGGGRVKERVPQKRVSERLTALVCCLVMGGGVGTRSW